MAKYLTSPTTSLQYKAQQMTLLLLATGCHRQHPFCELASAVALAPEASLVTQYSIPVDVESYDQNWQIESLALRAPHCRTSGAYCLPNADYFTYTQKLDHTTAIEGIPCTAF